MELAWNGDVLAVAKTVGKGNSTIFTMKIGNSGVAFTFSLFGNGIRGNDNNGQGWGKTCLDEGTSMR